MRVAVFSGAGTPTPLTIEVVPDPRPGPADVIVKVARCGICGSDQSRTSGSPLDFPPGRRLGHEFAGEVVECGRDVTHLKIGDRVACMPGAACGVCETCRSGHEFICPNARAFFGGFGDYVAVDERHAIRLPESTSMATGALVEPMAVGLHALRMAGFRDGEHLMVLGAGSMALAAVYWGRRLGARRIVVASRSAHRREIAEAMGADVVFSFDEDDPDALAALGMPDVVAECVGKSGMIDKAIGFVRPGGVVLSLGLCSHAEPIIPALCSFKELRMMFPLGYSLAEFEETARALGAEPVQLDLMVSDVIGLNELPEKLEAMRAGERTLKVQVDPTLRRS